MKFEISLNLWVGIGLVRGGVGIVFVGDLKIIVDWIVEYQVFGIELFIFFGYLYLEEVYYFVEFVFLFLLFENEWMRKF